LKIALLLAVVLGASTAGTAATPATAAAAAPAPTVAPPAEPPIETVEVVGERPGPSLWRVSKGDHVVWLLGTLDPLPKRMTWRSRQVESVISQAQEVLESGPNVSARVGPIAAIKLYMQWRRTEKIPEKSQLSSWLEPQLYARFSALKQRYDAHDKRIEELRPIFAARRLYEHTLDATKLTSHNDIQEAVLDLARKHHVAIVSTSLKLEDPKGVLTEVGEIPRAVEINCLEATVQLLETDITAMQARANAWAVGDVDALRKLPYPRVREVCIAAAATSPRIKALIDQAARDWNTALESALARNRSTLALKQIYDLIGPDGTLAQLRARGYVVEGP